MAWQVLSVQVAPSIFFRCLEMIFNNIFKCLVFIFCFTLFGYSVGVMVQKTYIDLLTGISLELVPEKTLILPTMTFCLEEPFKSAGMQSPSKKVLR